MNRVVMVAVALAASIHHGLAALPSHEITAGLGLVDGRFGARLDYRLKGVRTAELVGSMNIAKELRGLFRVGNPQAGFLLYGGEGSPANAIALRCSHESSGTAGNPLPWACSAAAGTTVGLGMRSGIFDLLLLMDKGETTDDTTDLRVYKPSAAAIQLAAPVSDVMLGCAISAAILEREASGDGWAEDAIPLAGGYFSTFSVAGRLSLGKACLEAWGGLCAGLLEPPGAAFSITGAGQIHADPLIRLRFGMFMSSGRYRNWLGQRPEYDMVVAGNIRAEWNTCMLLVDGILESKSFTGQPGYFTEGGLGFRAEMYGLKLQGEVQIDADGLDSAKASIDYGAGLSSDLRIGLSLAAGMKEYPTLTGGFSLDWRFPSMVNSVGRAVVRLSYEKKPDTPCMMAEASIVQKIFLSGWCSATVELRSPESGYRLASGSIPLPDASCRLSIVFPPP